jgi:2-dehydropantoate 2-reductase
VSVIARGAQLAAIRAQGLTLLKGERRITGKVQAAQDPREIGQVDYVIVTLKATSLPDFADAAAPLLGKDTAVVFAQNGIPWWYALGLSAARPAAPDLSALDPGGKLASAIAPERVVGSVVYSANEVVSPGVVRSNAPERNVLVLGEPDDRQSARLRALAAALEKSEIQAPIETDIRRSVWAKLVINLWSSSVGVITGGTVKDNLADPALAALRPVMHAEGRAIAAAHGVFTEGAPLPPPAPAGLQHKSSMLQDYEQGRPMEVDAILMAPLWFARAAQVPAPTLETVIALAAHKAKKKARWRGP